MPGMKVLGCSDFVFSFVMGREIQVAVCVVWFNVYCKPTNTDRFLDFSVFHKLFLTPLFLYIFPFVH